jgi:hypothetical protein
MGALRREIYKREHEEGRIGPAQTNADVLCIERLAMLRELSKARDVSRATADQKFIRSRLNVSGDAGSSALEARKRSSRATWAPPSPEEDPLPLSPYSTLHSGGVRGEAGPPSASSYERYIKGEGPRVC